MKRAPRPLKAATAIVGGMLIVAAMAFGQTQCPENYTQAQIDAANCIVGANIGAGLILIWAGPLFLGLIAVWGVVLFRKK